MTAQISAQAEAAVQKHQEYREKTRRVGILAKLDLHAALGVQPTRGELMALSNDAMLDLLMAHDRAVLAARHAAALAAQA